MLVFKKKTLENKMDDFRVYLDIAMVLFQTGNIEILLS